MNEKTQEIIDGAVQDLRLMLDRDEMILRMMRAIDSALDSIQVQNVNKAKVDPRSWN